MNNKNALTLFIAYIEGDDTIAKLSIINTFENFYANIKYNKLFNDAVDLIKSDLNIYANILKSRIIRYVNESSDANYIHQYDIPIAAYLLLLNFSSLKYSKETIEYLINKNLPNLWWGNAVANNIIRNSSSKPSTSNNVLRNADTEIAYKTSIMNPNIKTTESNSDFTLIKW